MTFEEWWNTYLYLGDDLDKEVAKEAWGEATCNANLQIEQLEGEIENYVTIISRLEDKLAAVNSKLTPEGYVLVPVEPTEAMVEAGYSEVLMPPLSCYKSMIKAAQEEE